MTYARLARCAAPLAALWLCASSCTVFVDSDRVQCASHDDCLALTDATPGEGTWGCFTGLCKAVECTSDGMCRGDATCDDEGRCVAPSGADCFRDADCGEDEPFCSEAFDCVECRRDEDCGDAQECGPDQACRDAKWGCIGDIDELPKAARAFDYKLEVQNLLIEAGIGAASGVACSQSNFECMNPVAEGSFNKRNVLTVPFTNVTESGFLGFIKIDSSETMPGYMHFFEPLVGPTTAQNRVLLFSTFTYSAVAGAAGVSGDPSEVATVIFVVYDCLGRLASGVSIAPDMSPDFAFIPIEGEMTPRFDLTATSEGGIAVIVNIVPGLRTFVLRDEDNAGAELGRATMFTQKAATNYMHWYPTHQAFVRGQEAIGQ